MRDGGPAASVGLVIRPKEALKAGKGASSANGDKQVRALKLYIHTLEYEIVADYAKEEIFGALVSRYCRQRSSSTSSFEGEASNTESEKSDDEIPIAELELQIGDL